MRYMLNPITIGFNKLSEIFMSRISIAPKMRAPTEAKINVEKILFENINIITPDINPHNIPPKVPS